MLSHAYGLPTRFRIVQPKEGNERPEGRDNFGPTHPPQTTKCLSAAGAGPDAGKAGSGRAAWPPGGAPLRTPSCWALSVRVWRVSAIATAAFIITQGRIPTPPGPKYPRLC